MLFSACSSTGGSDANRSDNVGPCYSGMSSTTIPDGNWYLLSNFGGPDDQRVFRDGTPASSAGPLACDPGWYDTGDWNYAAGAQRFGCGTALRITTGTTCAIAWVADEGPDQCVEQRAGWPILDTSPTISRQLFGLDWVSARDNLFVAVEEVDDSATCGEVGSWTELEGTPCSEPEGRCISNGPWWLYQCHAGTWYKFDRLPAPYGECS